MIVLPVINSLDPEVVEEGTEEHGDQTTGQVDGDQAESINPLPQILKTFWIWGYGSFGLNPGSYVIVF